MEANLVNVSGLVFDIIGATLIALSIALANSKIIRAQSFTVLNANPVLEYALILQREDARFGLGFLIIGFGLQLIAAFGMSAPISTGWITAIAVAIGLLFYGVRHRMLSASKVGKQAVHMMEVNATHLE